MKVLSAILASVLLLQGVYGNNEDQFSQSECESWKKSYDSCQDEKKDLIAPYYIPSCPKDDGLVKISRQSTANKISCNTAFNGDGDPIKKIQDVVSIDACITWCDSVDECRFASYDAPFQECTLWKRGKPNRVQGKYYVLAEYVGNIKLPGKSP